MVVESVRALTEPATEPVEMRTATGAWRVSLGRGHLSALVARVGPDGEVESGCVEDAAGAADFFAGAELR